MKFFRMKLVLPALMALAVVLSTFVGISRANNAGVGTGTYLAQTTVAAGDTVGNSITPTNFTSGAVIAAGQMSAGRTILCVFGGTLSTLATTTPTIRVRIIDSSGSGTPVLWSTGTTIALGTQASLTWEVRCYITCVVSGASGAVRVTGNGSFGNIINTAPIMGATAVAGTGTVTFDTTIAHTLVAEVTHGVADAGNTATLGYVFPFLGN